MTLIRTRPLPVQYRILLAIVALNYLAQIPYVAHQYGLQFSRVGATLLISTLVWFLVSFWLFRKGYRLGEWLLCAFLLTQFLFYFHNQVLLMANGYGLVFHLYDTHDWIIWLVQLIGVINFLYVAYLLAWLGQTYLRRGRP